MKFTRAISIIGEYLRKSIHTNILVYGLFVLVLSILAACSTIPEQPENPPISSITVVLDNNYPPYVFVDEKGVLQGILVDQWRKWEEYTGVNVDLIGLPWGEALDRMKAGEFDVIDTLFFTEERAKLYEYGDPYAEINVRIFFRKNISGISNAENLKGFRVAVKKGDANVEYLLGHDITSLLYYESYKEIVQAIANNEENIFVMDEPPALYYLFKNGIQDEFNYSEPLYSGEFHRAVRKGDTAILELVDRGFANISHQEYREIENRWFGTRQSSELALIMPYLGGVLFLALVVIISLFFFNRTLQSRVKERTDELHKSADQYRAVVENQTELIVRWKPDRTRTFVNDAYCRYFGFTHKQAMSIDFMSLIVEEDRQIIEEKITRLMSGVTDTETESHRVIKPDGNIGWQEWTEKAIRNENGEVIEFQSVGRDITKRKHAEDLIRESENRYRLIAENTADVIWVMDVETQRFKYVSPSVQKLRGYSPNEVMAQPVSEALTLESAKLVEELLSHWIPKFLADPTKPLSLTSEVDQPHKDGSIVHTEVTTTYVINEQGNLEIVGVSRDITERKLADEKLQESEVRYRTLFEDSPVPLLEEDFSAVKNYIDGLRESGIEDFRSYLENHPEATKKCITMVQVIDVNKAAVKWQESSNKEELLGSLGQFISASEYESFVVELINLIEDGTHYESTISRRTKDGKPIHLIVNGTVAPGYEKTWGRVLVSILDITESKIAEENLVKAYDTTLWGWAKALEFRDKETEGHSRRVVEITLKFAQALGIVDEDELVNIRRGAILHDIGKLSIPDEILLKPGQLTEGEWQIMSQHPWIGYKLLAPIEFLSGSLDIVRYHHEKWDGSGYLSGLKGEEIPLAARIFAVVDVWDAVQAERPYKKAWTRKKAIQHLQAEAGNQFDPHIVTVFLDLVEQGKI